MRLQDDQTTRPSRLRSWSVLAVAALAAVLVPMAWTPAAAGDGVSIVLSVSDTAEPSGSGSVAPTGTGQPSSTVSDPPVDPPAGSTTPNPTQGGPSAGDGSQQPGPTSTVPGSDDDLAWTGSTAFRLILPAVLLLVIGAAVVLVSRRRRSGNHAA